VREDRVCRALHKASVPDEEGAARRAWAVVERAYDRREPVRWTRRHPDAPADAPRVEAAGPADAALESRLDDELRDLD